MMINSNNNINYLPKHTNMFTYTYAHIRLYTHSYIYTACMHTHIYASTHAQNTYITTHIIPTQHIQTHTQTHTQHTLATYIIRSYVLATTDVYFHIINMQI